jgi:NMD protein affecting ribosome stability and mRNA decay
MFGSFFNIYTRMKVCKKCNIEKPLDNFWTKKETKDGLNRLCIDCTKIEAKKHYESNKEQYFNKRKWFFELKKELKCEQCGFNHPAALDFHHIDPSQKKFGISSNKHNKEEILDEIKKCKVLCSNCHRIKHASYYNRYF